jgi:hypothetical protein
LARSRPDPARRHADPHPRHGRQARRPESDGQFAGRPEADDRLFDQGDDGNIGGELESIADIKAGDYVASTGVKGTDGKIHAIAIGPDVPVLANGPGDISLLKPGAAVFELNPTATVHSHLLGKPSAQ